MDNISAYWVPPGLLPAGESRRFAYRVSSMLHDPAQHRGGRTVNSAINEVKGDPRIAIDFELDAVQEMDANVPEPVISTTNGEVPQPSCTRLANGNWRLEFGLRRDAKQPADVRAYLRRGADTLTETWTYSFQEPQ